MPLRQGGIIDALVMSLRCVMFDPEQPKAGVPVPSTSDMQRQSQGVS